MPALCIKKWNLIFSNMKNFITRLLAVLACASAVTFPVYASDMPDKLELTKVADNVYSAIGATEPGTYENHGHNNNLTFVITDDGVLVVNGGDNYLLAKALHNSIKEKTNQPVKYVVNENAQGHSFLGNSYWRDQGVPAIAHIDAIYTIKSRGNQSLESMKTRNKEKAEGTYVAVPDDFFEDQMTLQMGSTTIELHYLGKGHSPGDVAVWLPEQKIMIAGDVVFHERMLAIFPDSDTAAWIETFDRMLAFEPDIVVPGHGHPTTDIAVLTKETKGYLQFLRDEVSELLENGDGLAEAYKIDQSDYSHLATFEELAGKNAGRVFQELEFEFF